VRLISFGLFLLFAAGANAAPALVVESLAHEHDATTRRPLLRELPRQAVIITASEDLGLTVIDRTVDFESPDPAESVKLNAFRRYNLNNQTYRFFILDGSNTVLKTWTMPCSIENKALDYSAISLDIEKMTDSDLLPLVATATSVPAPTSRPAAAGDLPDGVEALLDRINPHSAFFAVRRIDGAIAASGQSLARLAGLARAYANLGESTRHLYAGYSNAFFSRSLIYAQELARKYPADPLSFCARGYALALLGLPVQARGDFDRARQLSADLARFQTRELFDAITPGAAPLQSYFAALTIEHSGLQNATISLARIAFQADPMALRMIDIMTENTGPGPRDATTQAAIAAQLQVLAALAKEDDAPAAVRAAAKSFVDAKFSPPTLLKLLNALRSQTVQPRDLLPWRVYANIAYDGLFEDAYQRLRFTEDSLGIDPSERAAAWWAILKDHRYGPVIASFDTTGKLLGGSEEIAKRIATIHFRDLPPSARYMNERLQKILYSLHPPTTAPNPFPRLTTRPLRRPTTRTARPATRHVYVEDPTFHPDDLVAADTSDIDTSAGDTVYDISATLWEHRNEKELPFVGFITSYIAKDLTKACPDHPSAIAELISEDWEHTRARAAELERDYGGNPQIALALAKAYHRDNRDDDSLRLLEQIVKVTPDYPVYQELTSIYRKRGDDEKYLQTWQEYLKTTDDPGLQHASVATEIAYTLMRRNRASDALPYAKMAAGTYSQWGLVAAGNCLTELGRYDDAEKFMQAAQERYGSSVDWYRWCITTHRGNISAARTSAAEKAAALAQADDWSARSEGAVYYEIEGQLDRARECWRPTVQDAYNALQFAMVCLQQNKMDEAKGLLEHFKQPPDVERFVPILTARDNIYRAAAVEVLRCIDNPAAVPARDGAMKPIVDTPESAYSANCAYFLGRLCELHGQKDDAKWWYRLSMSKQWTNSTRPQAAASLRRLGDEYYK
jgi:tetratricopeptide (TPR) repeat protein